MLWERLEKLLIRRRRFFVLAGLGFRFRQPHQGLRRQPFAAKFLRQLPQRARVRRLRQPRGGELLLFGRLMLPIISDQPDDHDYSDGGHDLLAVLLPEYIGLKLLQKLEVLFG